MRELLETSMTLAWAIVRLKTSSCYANLAFHRDVAPAGHVALILFDLYIAARDYFSGQVVL